MWQVLLAAAIAGSGYLAKHVLHKNDNESTNHSPRKIFENADAETSILDEEIFRFSSVSHGSKNPRKKLGRNRGNHERKVGSEKKNGDGSVDDHRKNRKKFAVCLKKRRTGRNAYAKCDSFDVKEKSSFGYGVGVGIMYMMSAGKAEIDRLNTTIDETAKVVQELKKLERKLLCDSNVERIATRKGADAKLGQSFFENGDSVIYSFPMSDEDGYASSIVTEKSHENVVEMDQLEAELESELLKLQVSTTQTSSSLQNKSSTEDLSKPQDLNLKFNKCNGVLPYELDQKLCHLLIEKQESQIVDLESELQRTNSKLVEKESELQTLKECVKRLTDFSLTCPSDEETEGQVDETHNKMISGNGRSMVGIKRAIDFD